MGEDREFTPPPGYESAKPFFGSKLEDNKLCLKAMSCEILTIEL